MEKKTLKALQCKYNDVCSYLQLMEETLSRFEISTKYYRHVPDNGNNKIYSDHQVGELPPQSQIMIGDE